MNQMNDDLISREEVYEAFSTYLNRSSLGEISPQTELSVGEIASIIRSVPTAFDKEKVINKIMQLDCEMDKCDLYKSCLDHALFMAKEIIKKGGLE